MANFKAIMLAMITKPTRATESEVPRCLKNHTTTTAGMNARQAAAAPSQYIQVWVWNNVYSSVQFCLKNMEIKSESREMTQATMSITSW
jgi:hypothetical protein